MNGKKARKLRAAARVSNLFPRRYNCKLEETKSRVDYNGFYARGKQLLCTDARVTYKNLKRAHKECTKNSNKL